MTLYINAIQNSSSPIVIYRGYSEIGKVIQGRFEESNQYVHHKVEPTVYKIHKPRGSESAILRKRSRSRGVKLLKTTAYCLIQ